MSKEFSSLPSRQRKAKQNKQHKNKMTDLLDIDLATVDTSFPVIAGPVMLDLVCTKSEVMDNEARTWKLTLATTSPTTDLAGATLSPGKNVFHTSNLAVTGKSTAEIVGRGVAQIVQGAGMTSEYPTPRQIVANPKLIEGKVMRCRVVVEQEHTDKNGVFRATKNIVQSITKKS